MWRRRRGFSIAHAAAAAFPSKLWQRNRFGVEEAVRQACRRTWLCFLLAPLRGVLPPSQWKKRALHLNWKVGRKHAAEQQGCRGGMLEQPSHASGHGGIPPAPLLGGMQQAGVGAFEANQTRLWTGAASSNPCMHHRIFLDQSPARDCEVAATTTHQRRLGVRAHPRRGLLTTHSKPANWLVKVYSGTRPDASSSPALFF